MPIDIKGNKVTKNMVSKLSGDSVVQRGLLVNIDPGHVSGDTGTGTIGDLSGGTDPTLRTGTCLRFDGSNDYVESTSSILRTLEGVTKYSVSMWINSDVIGAYDSFWGISNTHELHIYTNNLVYFWHNGGASANSGTVVANTWSFITATYSVDTQKLYQNGILQATATQSQGTSPTAGTTNMFVGKMTGNHFDGRMADVKVWNEVLTDGEIMELYKTPNLIVPSGMSTDVLELWWPLSEGYGTVAYDASGHGHHGTLTNGVAWESGQTDIPQLAGKNFSQKMIFDGSDDYINLGNSFGDFSTTTTTISCWVRTTSTTAQSIINDESSVGYAGLFLIYMETSGKILWRRGNSSNTEWGFVSTNTINDGGWHNIVCIDNGSALSMYIDGAAETASSNPGTYSTAAASGRNVAIGVLTRDYTTANFNGLIDEVAIWNVALNVTAIKALAATSNKTVLERSHIHGHSGAFVEYGAPKPPDARIIEGPSLKGYWRNDGKSEWKDLSDSSNNGTAVNAAHKITFPAGHINGRDSNGFPIEIGSFGFIGGDTDAGIVGYDIDHGNYFTLEAWVYYDNNAVGCSVVNKRTDYNPAYWPTINLVINSSGDVNGDYSAPGYGNYLRYTKLVDAIEPGRWNHIAFIKPGDYNSTKIIVNGYYPGGVLRTAYGSLPSDNGVAVANSSLSYEIGRTQDGSNYVSEMDGKIANVRVYNRALELEELAHNFHVERDKFGV
jgi:hypothetical protein